MRKISSTLFDLVQQLNTGGVHSGESLAETLKISRNAVWKHIHQLMKYGVEIDSLSGKGYQLKAPLFLLNLQEMTQPPIKVGLPIHDIHIFGSIASTNDEVRLLPRPQEGELVCCLAEHQTKGRGRFDRKWVSPFGQNMMLSMRVFLNKDISVLGGLTLAVSLAVRKALESFGLFSAQCKWPNDIYVEGKKLAGILVEAYGESHGLTELVIGIGLNVNMIEGGEEASGIEKPWISMQELLFLPQNRSAVARELIGVVSLYLSRFLEQGFDDFIEEWSVSDALVNEFITLKIGSQEIIGIARGINPLGHLKIEASDGKIMSFSSGEASVSGQITGFLT